MTDKLKTSITVKSCIWGYFLKWSRQVLFSEPFIGVLWISIDRTSRTSSIWKNLVLSFPGLCHYCLRHAPISHWNIEAYLVVNTQAMLRCYLQNEKCHRLEGRRILCSINKQHKIIKCIYPMQWCRILQCSECWPICQA